MCLLKSQFLHSHLVLLLENSGELSDEYGENVYRAVSSLEERYRGKRVSSMLSDCCWSVTRDFRGLVYIQTAGAEAVHLMEGSQ